MIWKIQINCYPFILSAIDSPLLSFSSLMGSSVVGYYLRWY